jgi:hypothetical protein
LKRLVPKLAAVATFSIACAALAGCAGASPAPVVARKQAEPTWQDVFDTTPELLVDLHPSAIEKDKVYGPLLRRIFDEARRRSRVVSSTRILEVMGDADEVIFGLRPSTRGGTDDAAQEVVVVVVGVHADVDPARVVDADGKALWSPGPGSGVPELVRERDEQRQPLDASLFELAGRTWVIATGDARARARQVFAQPVGRPALRLDPDALALLRVDGPSLVKRVRGLQPLGALAAVGRKLNSVTLRVPAGAEGKLELVFAYAEEDAAAFAEVAARQAVEAIGRKKPPKLAWLADAKVDRPDKRVVVTLALPAAVVDALLQAGSQSIDFDRGVPGTE